MPWEENWSYPQLQPHIRFASMKPLSEPKCYELHNTITINYYATGPGRQWYLETVGLRVLALIDITTLIWFRLLQVGHQPLLTHHIQMWGFEVINVNLFIQVCFGLPTTNEQQSNAALTTYIILVKFPDQRIAEIQKTRLNKIPNLLLRMGQSKSSSVCSRQLTKMNDKLREGANVFVEIVQFVQ